MTDEEAREKILSAAADLYYRKGYAAVGMDELRTTAGVSLRRLYGQFPSKSDVVKGVLTRSHDEWERDLTSRVDAAGPEAREQLTAVFSYLQSWFRADDFRGCTFINAFAELGGTDPEIAELVREHKQSFQQYMTGLVAELGGSELLAAQLAILAEGAQSTAAISGDPVAADQALAAAEVLIDASLRAA